MAWLDNLLGLNDPSQASQMGLAAGLLGASGPSTRPVSLGQAISAGLLGARQAGMDTQQSMRRDQLVQAQLMHNLLQIQEYQRKVKQEKDLEDAAAASFTPGVQNWQPGQGTGMPSPENIGTSIAPSFDKQAFLRNLARVSPIKAMEMMQKQQPIKLAAGETLYNPDDNQAIFTAPNKPTEGPSSVQEYRFAVQNGYRGSYEDWMKLAHPGTNVTVGLQSPYAAIGPDGRPIVLQPPNKPGAPAVVLRDPTTGQPVSPMPTSPQPTEFESKAGLYATSMRNASVTLDQIEKMGKAFVPFSEASTQLIAPDDATNVVRSKERQQYVQAQRQWIDSINRVRSGANLPEIEYSRAVKTFFPQFYDDKTVIAQKAQMRAKEEAAMVEAAGRASKRVPSAGSNYVYDVNTGKLVKVD